MKQPVLLAVEAKSSERERESNYARITTYPVAERAITPRDVKHRIVTNMVACVA